MTIETYTSGAVMTIVMDRPESRNAIDAEHADWLLAAFQSFDADDSAAVAVLTGAGHQFCSGGDLKTMGTAAGIRLDRSGDGPMGPSRLEVTKPVIAAVEGYAVAGGLELALWCDLRIVDDSAVFGVFCRRWGVPLIDGGTVRLPRLVGESRALDMILTGRAVKATEALEWGLANRLVARGQTLKAAQELARTIAGFPQSCVRSDRMSAREQSGMSEHDALLNEHHRGSQVARTEALVGSRRFAEGAGRHGTFD